ncbi:MAG: hypothetical protein GF421_07605 [Candidatus Aminicenantes bacterium]|nr:hypothetical protein [Candidatus Aminicenantes bacterium]
MKTYTEPKELVKNPDYQEQRKKCLSKLHDSIIDAPIRDIIRIINKLPWCFTLQSCFGHFVFKGQGDPQNLEPLPRTDTIDQVEYRIAYIAFCVENSRMGREWLKVLSEIPAIDPDNIQFLSASWFWKKQVNSYALQVEPTRFKHQDKAIIDYPEALDIEQTRNEFFLKLRKIISHPLNKI